MGRFLVLSVAVMGVIVLGAVAILLAGSGPPEAQRGTPGETAQDGEPTEKGRDDSIHPDARMYAKGSGVSLQEADRRLDMQGDTLLTRLERDLRHTEPDTFAGLWLRHKPDYGITVATAGEPEAITEKVESYVEGTQWEGTVRIKHVEATEAELNAARAEAERMLDRLGIGYDSGDNLFKNRMEIYVRDKTRVQRELRAAGLELPEHVIVLEGMATPDVPR